LILRFILFLGTFGNDGIPKSPETLEAPVKNFFDLCFSTPALGTISPPRLAGRERKQANTSRSMKLSTLLLCQTQAVADRLSALGYESLAWSDLTDDQATARDLVLIPNYKDTDGIKAGRNICARLKVQSLPVSIRSFRYPKNDDTILEGFSLDQEECDWVIQDWLNQCLREKPWHQRRRRLIEMGIGRFSVEPPEQEWVAGRLVPAGVPYLVAGRGGIGKTTMAIHLALQIASWDGNGSAPIWMGQRIEKTGVTFVLTYEEPTDNIHRIMHEMCKAEDLDPSIIDTRCIVKSMLDIDASGEPLVAPDPKTRAPSPTEEYHALTEELREIEREVGPIGCIVIDNLGTAYSVNGNDYQEANNALHWVQRWAAEFGSLVVNIGHTNKGAPPQRGRYGEAPRDLTDEEVLNTVMGSTGWISAHRATMVMWQLQEEQEQQLAKKLGDKDFEPGTTRRKYIHAQVLKENVRGIYTGRLTLRRDGVGLTDISQNAKHAKSGDYQKKMRNLATAIGKCDAQGITFMPTGSRGLYENRDALGGTFSNMKRAKLVALAKNALDEGILSVSEADGPKKLVSEVDDGANRKYRELAQRAVEVAFDRGKPFALDMKDPLSPIARRDELPFTLSGLNDAKLEMAFKLAMMHGEVKRSGQDGAALGHLVPSTA
jgi:hypothetical protein